MHIFGLVLILYFLKLSAGKGSRSFTPANTITYAHYYFLLLRLKIIMVLAKVRFYNKITGGCNVVTHGFNL